MTKFDFAMETTSKTIKDSLAVAAKRHFKVFKIGENYAIDFATKGYKIPEHGIYPEIKGRYWFYIKEGRKTSLFITDDREKFNKFKQYFQVNKINEREELDLETTDLEGKLFLSWEERYEMLKHGMFI